MTFIFYLAVSYLPHHFDSGNIVSFIFKTELSVYSYRIIMQLINHYAIIRSKELVSKTKFRSDLYENVCSYLCMPRSLLHDLIFIST